MKTKLIPLFSLLLLVACGSSSNQEPTATTTIMQPAAALPTQAEAAFNADSAYAYVANQVAFGPRVPNTKAHKQCGDYLAAELVRFGAKV